MSSFKTIIAKNQTAAGILLEDTGITVPASGQYSLSDELYMTEISNSESLRAFLVAGDIVLNDGVTDLSLSQSLALLDLGTQDDGGEITTGITWTAHGFGIGTLQIPIPIYFDVSSNPQLAVGSDPDKVAIAFVVEGVDVNTVKIINNQGYQHIYAAHGLNVGEAYWLDQATPGQVTDVKPTTGIFQRVLEVIDADTMSLVMDQSFNLIGLANTKVTYSIRTLGQNNLNALTAFTEPVLWDISTELTTDAAPITLISTSEIQFNRSMVVKVSSRIYNTATATRPNVGLGFTLDGVDRGVRGAGGYIRNNGGHNESSTSVSDFISVAAGQILKVIGFRLAAAGTVTTIANAGILLLEEK